MRGSMIALTLWVAALASSVLFCAITVTVARAVGGRVRAVVLFLGPRVARTPIGSLSLELGALPLPVGYVAFERDEADDELERSSFHDLSRPRRLAILGAPWIGISLACVALLGPEALGSIARGFAQIPMGALSPTGTGHALVARLFALAATEPAHVLGARVITKMVAFNLLPLPGLAGLTLLTELVRRSRSVGLHRLVSIAGTLALLAIAGGWAWALIAYALA